MIELSQAAIAALVAAELAKPQAAIVRPADSIGTAPYAVLWFGQVADTVTLVAALESGFQLREGNPVFGPRPSTARLVSVKLAIVGVSSITMHVLQRKHPKGVRFIGYGAGAAGFIGALLNWQAIR